MNERKEVQWKIDRFEGVKKLQKFIRILNVIGQDYISR